MGKQISIVNDANKKIKSNSTFTIPLCEFCTKRNFRSYDLCLLKYSTNISIQSNHQHTCFICENFFQEVLPSILTKINSHLSDLDLYKPKIDIGTTLPYRFYENEDYVRSMFQIRGIPNIKNQINFCIRENIQSSLELKIDHINPELKYEIVIYEDLSFSINSKNRQFYLLGSYKKIRRGIPQKKQIKRDNSTHKPNDEKLMNYAKSVESFVIDTLNHQYGTNAIKISWTGGEDKDSLVMGSGRPFVVKISSSVPVRKRKEIFDGDGMEISFERIEPNILKNIHRYKQIVKVLVVVKGDFSIRDELEEKVKSIVGSVKFEMKNKTLIRNVYESTLLSKKENYLELLICLDNGIPIKQLIGGQDPIEPSLSSVLKCKCECKYFDILEFIQSI